MKIDADTNTYICDTGNIFWADDNLPEQKWGSFALVYFPMGKGMHSGERACRIDLGNALLVSRKAAGGHHAASERVGK